MRLLLWDKLNSEFFYFQDEWTASVTLVVGNQIEDSCHLDMMAKAIESGARKLFGVCDRKLLYEEVIKLHFFL